MNDENRWFRVVRDGQWFWVAQNNVPMGDVIGAAVLPVTKDGVILQRHKRPSQRGAETIEIPRGLRDAGESVADSARRELLEETGLSVSAADLRLLGHIRPDTGLLAARVALYWADVEGQLPGQGDGEAQANFELSRAELRDWLRADRIEDAFTLAAILRLMLLRPDWLSS